MNSDIMFRYYKFIFENSTDAIFLTTPDGNIFKANTAACDMFKNKEYEIREHGVEGIFDHNDPRLVPALKKRSVDGNFKTELTFLRGDGSTFTGECMSATLNDEDNKEWTVTIVRDKFGNMAETGIQLEDRDSLYMVRYDTLTGVLNRRSFVEEITHEMNRSIREQAPMSLLLLDIDSFRSINEKYGYLFADYTLRKLALFLSVSIRNYDILGRFGEDEFIICLPNTDTITAEHVADQLLNKIKMLEIENEGISLTLGVTIGVASFSASSHESVNALILKLNQRLYRAKAKSGKAV